MQYLVTHKPYSEHRSVGEEAYFELVLEFSRRGGKSVELVKQAMANMLPCPTRNATAVSVFT